jgi:hypothetical protein
MGRKPRNISIEYLGTVESLLKRLRDEDDFTIKYFSHSDTAALLNVVLELGIMEKLDSHILKHGKGEKPTRDGLTVGGTFLLGAIGRACRFFIRHIEGTKTISLFLRRYFRLF